MPDVSGYYRNTRSEVLRFLPGRYHKVLEIGCGGGTFRAGMDSSCEYWGVEPFKAAAELASKKLYRVLTGTYEQVYDQLPDCYFDLVICNDVIEHMADHDAFFQTIKRKMTNDSFIVGSIPNVRFFWNLTGLLIRREWKYADYGILDRTHLRFFTERSLRRTLLEHEFAIEEFGGINRLSFAADSLKNVIRRILMRALGSDTAFTQFGFRVKYTHIVDAPSHRLS